MKRQTTTRHPAEASSGRRQVASGKLAAALALLLLLTAAPAVRGAEDAAETFRADLIEAVRLLGEMTELMPGSSEMARAARLEKEIRSIDGRALGRFQEAIQPGDFQQSVEELRQLVLQLRDAVATEETVTEEEISPPYSSLCGDDRPSITVLKVALDLAEDLELLDILAHTACDASPSGDFEQLNVVVCLSTAVTGELSMLAQIVYENCNLCNDDIDSAEINAAYELADQIDGVVEENLDEQVSTRASQDSLDDHAADVDAELATVETQLALVQGDVSGLVSGVANLQAELDDVQVRVTDTQLGVDDLETRVSDIEQSVDDLRIEVQDLADTTNALARALDDFIDSSQSFEALNLQILIEGDLERRGTAAVSLFQLPASVGGYLELAREIVITTIEANQAAGQGVGGASELVTEGDLLFNAEAYRDAYHLYREAYHQATGRLGS